jgi:hypothetical protein
MHSHAHGKSYKQGDVMAIMLICLEIKVLLSHNITCPFIQDITLKSSGSCTMGKWLADGFPPRQMLSPYNNKQEKSCKT